MDKIEIPFGAYDSETLGWTYTIPKDYTAKIEDGKIIVKKEESEDERNIDTIFNCLYQCCDTGFISGTQRDNALAYLEKQKEQKEIPLMNGDADLYFDNWIQHNDTTKRGCFEEGIRYAQRLQKEHKSTEYIKRNSKEWYALLSEQYNKGFWKGKTEQNPRKFKLGDKVHWYDDDTNVITITGFRDDAYLTDSAYGPILFCDEDNWERIEQKPAEWSEEDEDKLEQCIRIVSGWERDYDIVKSPYSNFLKSLRPPQYCENCKLKRSVENWKPSKEQMEALRSAVNKLAKTDVADSVRLSIMYDNLKKLM